MRLGVFAVLAVCIQPLTRRHNACSGKFKSLQSSFCKLQFARYFASLRLLAFCGFSTIIAFAMPSFSVAQESIWVEGESCSEKTVKGHSWYDQVVTANLSGGAWLSNFAAGKPATAAKLRIESFHVGVVGTNGLTVGHVERGGEVREPFLEA